MAAGIHMFDSTKDAYDACQCGNDFKGCDVNRGDLLIVPSEKVIGISDTWPIALTYAGGELHSLAQGFTLGTNPSDMTGRTILASIANDDMRFSDSDITLASLLRRVRVAKRIIKNKGWCMAPYVDVK